MTLVEKIFAKKLKRKSVSAGESFFVPLDLIVATELAAPFSIETFEKMNVKHVFDSSKLVLINDHFVPAKDIAAAKFAKITREFAKEHRIKNYFEVGRCGICHITVPDEGLVAPGDIIIGADSHTCTYGALGAFATGVGSTDLAAAWALGELWFKVPETIKIIFSGKLNKHVVGKDLILCVINKLGVSGAIYKALEFSGPIIDKLSMADRFTICNMAVECGAKSGLIAADSTTVNYLKGIGKETGLLLNADKEAVYFSTLEIDVSEIEPLVATPFLPSNVIKAKDIGNVIIDQIVIGSCTNGRIEDFRLAHSILQGHKVKDTVRLIIIPGSPSILKKMHEENILSTFIDAGAVIAPSTCGPCIGGHMGVLADHEVGLYTTNRNFKGRCGAPTSKVYLCNPAVAAFSAIKGHISISY